LSSPRRGEIWLSDLDPIHGREQAGRRPVLVISEDLFNQGPADLVIVLPLTSRLRPIPTHISVSPPEGGLKVASQILCEAVRSISKDRLILRWGEVSQPTLDRVADCLRILQGL
jgi:mRNA interferase MazF